MKYYKLVEMDACPSEAWAEAKVSLDTLVKRVCSTVREEQKKIKNICGQEVFYSMVLPIEEGEITIFNDSVVLKRKGYIGSVCFFSCEDNKKINVGFPLRLVNSAVKALYEVTAEDIRRHLEDQLAR